MAVICKPLAEYKDTILNTGIRLETDDIPKKPIKRLVRFFKAIEDKRIEKKIDYPLYEILLIAFFAIFSGADTWTALADFGAVREKWLKKFLPLANGVPSHDTFRRVFALIDPEHLQKATVAFLIDNMKIIKRAFHIPDSGLHQYCVDGKESNGTGRSKDAAKEIRNLHTLHVYDLSDGICLVSKVIDSKTNEIPTAQEVLSAMQLKGALVSFDALNTQTKTISVIAEQKGDYIGALKGNQQKFFEEVRLYFSDEKLKEISSGRTNYHEEREKSHSCVVTRKVYLTTDVSWFADKANWPKLKGFLCYVKTTENVNTGKITIEYRYYITSLTDVKLCADGIRGHWKIENQLHWNLDANFDEDDNMTVDRNAFQNFSLMNKLALSLLKLVAPIVKKSIRATKKISGWDPDRIMKILCALDEDILSNAMMKVKK